jgi:mannose-6-phosphate isomerase-like protein (cupin superfamily)
MEETENRMRSALAFLLLLGVAGPAALAAGSDSGDAVVTKADIQDAMKNAKVNPGAVPGTFDQTLRVLDTGDAHVGAAIIRRVQPEDKDALVHAKVTEIYEITEGGGTLELGGTLVGGKPFVSSSGGASAIGPSTRGTGIQGGHSRHVTAGDVVIIPAGIPHRFSTLDGPITYLCFRFDPSRVTPLK